MSKPNWILMVTALSLIGATAGLLLGTHQKLGAPGVKTKASDNPARLEVELPAQVLDYKSEWNPVDDITKATLPKDTSFGNRTYEAPDQFKLALNVVLMGTDRTSLHKPQFCLEGQGFHIDPAANLETKIHIDRPCAYDLPVVRLIATGEAPVDGQKRPVKIVYVYWFVADDALSSSISGYERMWMMGSKLLRTGVLQRWAYVSCSSLCLPGQEDAAFERLKSFIAAAVPEFQLNPRAPVAALSNQ